jgi:Xaa-Pro aminopeptidase
MAAAGLGALVSLSPENVAYTSGVVVPSQPLMRWRHAATVLCGDGTEAMVCVDMEETLVRTTRPDLELRAWAEFGGSAMATLATLLSDLGLSQAVIGVEQSYLPVKDHEELRHLLPQARFLPCDDILVACRRTKTREEVALLGELSRIADRSIADSCQAVGPGCTEMDIAGELTGAVYRYGAQQFKLMIVASGPRSQLPNGGPTPRVLKAGDICRIEIFPVIDGYHAGVCRTAVVGPASHEAQRIYSNLVECKRLVLGALVPGNTSQQVYEVFRSRFDQLGMPPISFVGHGIGLDLHEPPYLASFDTSNLEPGLVMGIEPLVYRTGHGFGMQIKDMVAIEEQGPLLLSDLTSTDELLVID